MPVTRWPSAVPPPIMVRRSPPPPGSSPFSRTATGWSAPWCATSSLTKPPRSVRNASSMPPACGSTTSRTWRDRPDFVSMPPRASTSSCHAIGSRATVASSCVHRHRSSSSSRGGTTGCSAPPTPRGISIGHTRPPHRRTSTTCSSRRMQRFRRHSPAPMSSASTPVFVPSSPAKATTPPSSAVSMPSLSPPTG